MNRVDDENPEWTRASFRKARPAEEVFERFELPKPRKARGPQKAPTKVQTTIRLDSDVIEYFKNEGNDWRSRINETLRRAIDRRRTAKRKTRV